MSINLIYNRLQRVCSRERDDSKTITDLVKWCSEYFITFIFACSSIILTKPENLSSCCRSPWILHLITCRVVLKCIKGLWFVPSYSRVCISTSRTSFSLENIRKLCQNLLIFMIPQKENIILWQWYIWEMSQNSKIKVSEYDKAHSVFINAGFSLTLSEFKYHKNSKIAIRKYCQCQCVKYPCWNKIYKSQNQNITCEIRSIAS